MSTFKSRLAAGDRLTGTFVKTPAIEMVEVLAKSGLDFLCIDAEHCPFGKREVDLSVAVGRAMGLPMLVRVPAGRPEIILGALDSGATGIVVPHVDSPEKAALVAKAARYTPGGRGFAGATRWADYGGASMADLMARSHAETVVLAQIEEPEAVASADAIAAAEGIDGLFIGPSDLSLAMGKTDRNSQELVDAFRSVGDACRRHGKALVTWVPDIAGGQRVISDYGVTVTFVASEQTWLLEGARAVSQALKAE